MIQELHSKEIDKKRWDSTVSGDSNGRIYSMSWFLDAVTDNNWRGFIGDNYESVMPFVLGQKFGIKYCYMPYLVQQFSVTKTKHYLPAFIRKLRSRCSYGQFAFSDSDCEIDDVVEKKNNFELSLNRSYAELWTSFSSNHKTNINRFKKGNCFIAKSEQLPEVLALFVEEKSSVFSSTEMKRILMNIERIYEAAIDKGLSRLFIASDEKGIVGGALFIEQNNRLYYLFGIAKRKLNNSQSISYGLLNHVIQEYAERPIILDFEGSQIESIKYFFNGFGAINHPYAMIKWNDLPFFVKWIKK